MDGTDVCVGMTVRFREGFESEYYAAIVTEVSGEQVSLHIFVPGYAQGQQRAGVLHSSHPQARRRIEAGMGEEGGIWDYVERQPPREVDKSQQESQPRKKMRPPSAVRDPVGAES